jgi:uncharacterized membrane protein
MDKRLSSVVWSLLGTLALFALVVFVLGNMLGIERFQTDNATLALRFGFVILGLPGRVDGNRRGSVCCFLLVL